MADFLIKNTNHWMDKFSPEEAASKGISFFIKYEQRYTKGDVIEIAENNRWLDHQHGNGKFLIVRVPFLTVEQANEYVKPLFDDNGAVSKRRRYRLWFETLSEEDMEPYEIAPFVYKVDTLEELLLFGQDKFDEVLS